MRSPRREEDCSGRGEKQSVGARKKKCGEAPRYHPADIYRRLPRVGRGQVGSVAHDAGFTAP